jgi:tRNA pseudouridine55 synthase
MPEGVNPPTGSPLLRTDDPFDGVLVVNKPAGPTSHDIVDHIRRRFGIRKVGHGGTLDPRATGLLIILLGRGTKLAELFTNSDKVYEGTLRLGVATDSGDAEGAVISEADPGAVTRDQLEAELRKRTGDLRQVPPMVSAVKVGGVPLYRHARKGQTVEREPRLVHIYEFALLEFAPPRASFRVRCTKGTYVRALASDIGEALGCGAHLESLCRTKSGAIGIEQAAAMDEIMHGSREELRARILPLRTFTDTERMRF